MNSTKKSVVMLLILCVFFPCLAFISACGNTDVEKPKEKLTKHNLNGQNVYSISSVEDWGYFMQSIKENNETFENEIVEITANLDFKNESYQYYTMSSGFPTNVNWAASTSSFRGTLNGNGHTLSNITIKHGFEGQESGDLRDVFRMSAIFDGLKDATVTNLKISGVNFVFNVDEASDFDFAFRKTSQGDYLLQKSDPVFRYPALLEEFSVGVSDEGVGYIETKTSVGDYGSAGPDSPSGYRSYVSVLTSNIYENTEISNVHIEDVNIIGLDKSSGAQANVIVSDFSGIYSRVISVEGDTLDKNGSVIKNCYVDLDSKHLKVLNGVMMPESSFENEPNTCYQYLFNSAGIGGTINAVVGPQGCVSVENCVVKHKSNNVPICGTYIGYRESVLRYNRSNAEPDGLNGLFYPLMHDNMLQYDADYTNSSMQYTARKINNCVNSDSHNMKKFATNCLENGGYCSSRGGVNGNTYLIHKQTDEAWVEKLPVGSFNYRPMYDFDGDPVYVNGYEIKNDVWYYSEEFCKANGGFPVLRNFMDWRKLNFNIANENVGKVDVGYELLYINEANPVYIPYKEGTQISLGEPQTIIFKKEANSLDLSDNFTVYGQQIEIEILDKIKNYYTITDKEWLWSAGKWNKIEKDSAVTTLKEIQFMPSTTDMFTYDIKLISRDFVIKFFDNNPNDSQLGDPISESSYPSSEYLYDIYQQEKTDLNTCKFMFEKKSIVKKSENGILYEDAVIYTEHGSYRLDVEYVNDQCVVSVSRCGGAYGNPDFQLNNANLIKFHDAMVYDEYTGKKYVSDSIKCNKTGDYTGSDYTVHMKKYIDKNDQNTGIIEYYSADKSCKYYYDTRIYEYVTAVDQGMSQLDLSNLDTNNGSVKVKCEVCIAPVFKQKYVTINVKINPTESGENGGAFGLNSQESFIIKSGDNLSKCVKFTNLDENETYRSILLGNVKINALAGYNIKYKINNGKIDLFNGVNLYSPVYDNQTINILFEKILYRVRFYGAEGSELQGLNEGQSYKEVAVPYGTRITSEYVRDSSIPNNNNTTGYVVIFSVAGKTITYKEKKLIDDLGNIFPYRYYGYAADVGKNAEGTIESVEQDMDIIPVFVSNRLQYCRLVVNTTGPKSTTQVENIFGAYGGAGTSNAVEYVSTVLSVESFDNSSTAELKNITDGTNPLDCGIGFKLTMSNKKSNTIGDKYVMVSPENSVENGTWMFKSVTIEGYSSDGDRKFAWSYTFEDLYCTSEHKNGNLCKQCKDKYIRFINSIGKDANLEPQYATITEFEGKKSKQIVEEVRVFVEYTRLYTLSFENPVEIDENGNVFATSNASGGSNWLTFTSSLSNVEILPNFTYVKGQSNDLKFNISTIKNNVKYNINRYYAVDGLKLNSCLYKNGNQVHVYNEVVSGGRLNLSKYGNVFTIAPVIKLNAVKVNINYNTKIYNANEDKFDTVATLSAKIDNKYAGDSDVNALNGVNTGSMTVYFEYGSTLIIKTGEYTYGQNFMDVIINESGTDKVLILSFVTISSNYTSNLSVQTIEFNVLLHGSNYNMSINFVLA